MKQRLSSEWTGFFKFFPALWISLFGLATAGLFLGVFQGENGSAPPTFMKFLFPIMWVAGSCFSYLACASLKEVSVDEHFLYVSNYIADISIPLTDVRDVTENIWLNIHPVTVHLAQASRFGTRVTFMPERAFSYVWTSHPIVGELKTLGGIN